MPKKLPTNIRALMVSCFQAWSQYSPNSFMIENVEAGSIVKFPLSQACFSEQDLPSAQIKIGSL